MKQSKRKEQEEFRQRLYNGTHGSVRTPETLETACSKDNPPERIGEPMLETTLNMPKEYVPHLNSGKGGKCVLRRLRPNETELLKDFLYEAIFIPEGAEMPARDIIEKPELRVYIDDFGARKGDNCLAADIGGKVVGAVWTRIMNDYGHIDDNTPSMAISLFREYRGQGIGAQLMVEMLALLKRQGFSQASLAVQKTNYAFKMYRNIGFKPVRETAEEYIMVCELSTQEETGQMHACNSEGEMI